MTFLNKLHMKNGFEAKFVVHAWHSPALITLLPIESTCPRLFYVAVGEETDSVKIAT